MVEPSSTMRFYSIQLLGRFYLLTAPRANKEITIGQPTRINKQCLKYVKKASHIPLHYLPHLLWQ